MDNTSLGVKLASLREKIELTQDDIARKLHVCTAVVVDIENGNLTNSPLVFMKGYLRTYADIVGLPSDEYLPYIDALKQQNMSYQMKNYSQKNKNKKRSKWLLVVSVLIILFALGVTAYCVWKDNQSNFVEVSHYISPVPTDRINS